MFDKLEGEIWKPIEGFEGLYDISSHGRVFTHQQFGKGHREARIRKQFLKSNGYLRVNLSKNNTQKGFYIHRLVAQNFIENPENKPQVNHIDCVKTNNHVNNLEWTSAKENVSHAWNNGLYNCHVGQNHHNSRLSNTQVKEIKTLLKEGVTQSYISKLYNISEKHVSKINVGYIWRHIVLD